MRRSHAFLYDRILARDRTFDGRFYTAVTTTGIYCLPSCPARKPKAEHTRFFATEPEAVTAGFRPCRRCRPERFRAGEDGDRSRLEALLARIRKGIARYRTVTDLTEETGIGRTKLTEDFRHHLHLSPAAFLQGERVRAAQRLLTGTPLALSTVAQEVGFESPSVFHAQFRRWAAMTPARYRDVAAGAAFDLLLPKDFRAEDLLAYHGRDPRSLCERVEESTLRKALPGQLLEITFRKGAATCRVHQGVPTPETHALALRMLGLGQDPASFERGAAQDPLLGGLVRARPGLRIPLTSTVWEALVWAILGQQVNLSFAHALRRALVERCGKPVALGMKAHPPPEAVAALALEDLLALRLSRAKAECLLRVAQEVERGALDLEGMPHGTATRAAAGLMAVKGIGPWTTQYVLMRGCGFTDCVPLGDAGLTLALQRQVGLDHRPTPSETAALLASFAPWRSLAVFHLWAGLKGVPA